MTILAPGHKHPACGCPTLFARVLRDGAVVPHAVWADTDKGVARVDVSHRNSGNPKSFGGPYEEVTGSISLECPKHAPLVRRPQARHLRVVK
jgi:hypothetical protein